MGVHPAGMSSGPAQSNRPVDAERKEGGGRDERGKEKELRTENWEQRTGNREQGTKDKKKDSHGRYIGRASCGEHGSWDHSRGATLRT